MDSIGLSAKRHADVLHSLAEWIASLIRMEWNECRVDVATRFRIPASVPSRLLIFGNCRIARRCSGSSITFPLGQRVSCQIRILATPVLGIQLIPMIIGCHDTQEFRPAKKQIEVSAGWEVPLIELYIIHDD